MAIVVRYPDPHYRPVSTQEEDSIFDIKTSWVAFWEWDQLHELPHDERRATGDLVGYESGKSYKESFVPDGPTLVVQP